MSNPDPFKPEPKSQAMRIEIDPENLNGLLRPVLVEINSHTAQLSAHQESLEAILRLLEILVEDFESRQDDGK